MLSGLGMGTLGALLLQRNFSITRTHAALIDVGGIIGIIGGLAVESVIYQQKKIGMTTDMDGMDDPRSQEHLANFALGGMAVGLVVAGVLTRDIDSPKIAVTPTITQAAARDGRGATVYGVSGTW